jgi:amino acid adenylation domain-containing protein
MNKKNVLQWLEDSARLYPEKTAFADPTSELTYLQLLTNAEKIGSFLCHKISMNEPVSFYLEKSTIAISGMLGAVYAGGFYSLLDTRQPEARLNKILDVLAPKILLTDQENYAKAVEMFQGRNIEIESIEEVLADNVIDPAALDHVRCDAMDTDPLYVNFTSGSTGTPKGVTVCHRSVIDFIEILDQTFGLRRDDVIGNQAPFDFDVSVKDIFSGIYLGATVQIIPREYFSNPMTLMDYLCDRQITVLIWAVSAMCFVSIMNGFGYKIPSDVRLVMFSGEVMPIKQLNKWRTALPKAKYVNLYGPTEITCNCTYHVLEDREYALDELIPIGKSFSNEKVFLLDEEDHLITEPNVQGEICASGTCVAEGYYKDPAKTDEVFTQNPLNQKYHERIYRTGDLGRYLENGELVYTSRKDFQIKHLGHRIELGEIETAVQARDQITRACCIYDALKKRILVFYTGDREGKELLSELRDVLPPFMLPNKLMKLDEMPMTKNGKIDRRQLKELGGIKQ